MNTINVLHAAGFGFSLTMSSLLTCQNVNQNPNCIISDEQCVNNGFNDFTQSNFHFDYTNTIVQPVSRSNETSILTAFVKSIVEECKPMDSEFSKLIDENFWDLI